MRNLLLIIGFAGFFSMFFSCTKQDCDCTYYNERGEIVESYSEVKEEMSVSNCSVLDTYVEGDSIAGFICK